MENPLNPLMLQIQVEEMIKFCAYYSRYFGSCLTTRKTFSRPRRYASRTSVLWVRFKVITWRSVFMRQIIYPINSPTPIPIREMQKFARIRSRGPPFLQNAGSISMLGSVLSSSNANGIGAMNASLPSRCKGMRTCNWVFGSKELLIIVWAGFKW